MERTFYCLDTISFCSGPENISLHSSLSSALLVTNITFRIISNKAIITDNSMALWNPFV